MSTTQRVFFTLVAVSVLFTVPFAMLGTINLARGPLFLTILAPGLVANIYFASIILKKVLDD